MSNQVPRGGGGIYQLRVPTLPQDQSLQDQTHQAQSHVAQPQPMYSAQNMMFHPNPGGAGFPPPGLVYRHPVMGYPSAAISQQRFLPQQQHRPSAQPTSSGSSDAKSRQEFEKQLTLERQRQKLQQIGAGSVRPTQLNPEAMIASIVGPTGTPTRLKNQHLPSQTSAHSTIAPMHQMAGFSQEHSGIHSSDSTKRSEVKQTQHQPEMTTILNPLDPSRPGIEAVMKECAELSVSGSKPRAFHHATLNEIQSTNLQGNQQTFVPDSKATTWSYKQAENLEGIFILPTTPTQAAMRPQGGFLQQRGVGPRQQVPPPAPGGDTRNPPPTGFNPPPPAGFVQWPEWLWKDDVIPEQFHNWLSFCGNPDWPNTGIVYNMLVTSGLPRETLGHIWALVNRSYTGQLTKQEFFAALVLVALAQHGKPVTMNSLSSVDRNDIPIPKFQQQSAGPSLAPQQPASLGQEKDGRTESKVPSALNPSSAMLNVPEEGKRARSSSEDEFGEFTDFRAAESTKEKIVAPPGGGGPSGGDGSDFFGALKNIVSAATAEVNFSAARNELPMHGTGMKPLEPTELITVEHFPIKSLTNVREESGGNSPDSGSVRGESKEPSLHSLDLKSMKSPEEELENNAVLVSESAAIPTSDVILGDKYAAIKENRPPHECEDEQVCVWMKCLNVASKLLKEGTEIFGRTSSSSVCREVLSTEQGSTYFRSMVEIYRVACRIRFSIKTMTFQTEKLVDLLNDIDLNWDVLQTFAAGNNDILPKPGSLNFGNAILSKEEEKTDLCGVCLLNVEKEKRDKQKLEYAGRPYHAQCANLWVNCIDSLLPALTPPDGLI